ncbi:hypothetical protein ANCDUO_14660 [Ancylostoma duodenale]|uniref:Uncharacterized protein n=1 Tax=Ancylostoma duodenale TaxID=51022 RepID=A0A0C2CZE0_9BILA|nr:hypothetical protein ANCDUO_14660 [Ancylostoma duodenale]
MAIETIELKTEAKKKANAPRSYSSSRYGPPTQTRHRMIVENLSTRISWQVVPNVMCACWRVASRLPYGGALGDAFHIFLNHLGHVDPKLITKTKSQLVDVR